MRPGANGDDISVTMRDVDGIEREDAVFIMDTGSPHYVKFVEDLEEIDVVKTGRSIRNIARFRADGINVNFVEVQGDCLRVSTYERGVEDQTLGLWYRSDGGGAGPRSQGKYLTWPC